MKKRNMLIELFALSLIAAAIAAGMGCRVYQQFGARPDPEAYQTLPGWKDGTFHNQEPIVQLRKKKASKFRFLHFLLSNENAPREPVVPAVPEFPARPAEFAICWFGHSTLYWELGGARFLTDPVFGNAAPVPFAVNRMMPPPVDRKKLPELDFILISHDHYDHLEYDTIRFFRKGNVKFVTMPGVGARLRGWGIPAERIVELPWYKSVTIANVTITTAPARHFSGRSLKDRNCTQWGSFILGGGKRKIFFGGDGGYGKHFREIGDKYGPFDYALLEIDAWNTKWRNNHMFPQEFPLAVRDLRARAAVPIHWGVFDLAGHPWQESILLVSDEMRKATLPLYTPYPGTRWSGEITKEWFRESVYTGKEGK